MASPSSSRSDIWYHFEKVKTKTGTKGKCRYCQNEIAITGGATSNLKRHLSKKHVTVPIERHEAQQENRSRSRSVFASISEEEVENTFKQPLVHDSPSLASTSSLSSSPTISLSPSALSTPVPQRQNSQASMTSFVDVSRPIPLNRSRQIDIQLLKMICSEYHPFSLVEDKEFKAFVNMLCSTYKLPSRKSLSNGLLISIHDSLVVKITGMLEEAYAVCLTCDGWTNINTTSFYAITAHFIDYTTKLNSILLECSEKYIIVDFLGVTKKFKLDFKTVAVVTDNAPNIKAAIKTLGLPHLSCFAHSLNLVVQRSINESIKSAVDKVKSIVQFFKQSSHAMAKLREMQANLSTKPLKLKQDVPTRWNSTYEMLDRIMKNREPVISVLALLNPKILLGDITEEVSSEQKISLSKTCILAQGLARSVRRTIENVPTRGNNLSEEVLRLGKNLLEALSNRFGDRLNVELINQAIFLDPRFKKHGFGENTSRFLEVKNKIIEKIQSSIPATTVGPVAPEVRPVSASSIWKDFDAAVNQFTAAQDPKANATIQVDKYLAEPIIDRRMDPLVWWHERKTIFPDLFLLMQKRLCIPATSVPCERLFSKAGNICTQKRSCLTSSKTVSGNRCAVAHWCAANIFVGI
ncbi:hypothetical protein LAZ67_10003097 [Cordylochernes scorpioides]|uniref:BED-type domain-containing protein n=1 Tax=Cordylochernes scorpioides TaxID=51811 RepID=A0ABY6KZT7_9ARAC|nr:hypothetical protein LAZ67_10003097 [Cordylochernes scorpioides]